MSIDIDKGKELVIHSDKHGRCVIYYDKEDDPLIKQYHWHIGANGKGSGFQAVTGIRDRNGKKSLLSMPRLLMRPIPKGMTVWHKDKNPFNNTRNNLELR